MLRMGAEVTEVVMPVLWCSQAVARRPGVTCLHAWTHQVSAWTSIVGPPPVDAYDSHCGYSIKARYVFDEKRASIDVSTCITHLFQCVTFFFFVLLDSPQY